MLARRQKPGFREHFRVRAGALQVERNDFLVVADGGNKFGGERVLGLGEPFPDQLRHVPSRFSFSRRAFMRMKPAASRLS